MDRVQKIIAESGLCSRRKAEELIEDGKSGLIVPIKNPEAIAKSVLKLKHNNTLRINIGISAKKRISDRFHINHTISETLNLYNKLSSDKI